MWSLQQEFKLGWSSARVETFQRYPNPKEAQEVSNYRPISLLSLASEALCLQPYHIAHFHSASPSTIRLWPRKVNHFTASARSSGYSSSVGVSQPCRLTLSTLILWKHLTRLYMFFFLVKLRKFGISGDYVGLCLAATKEWLCLEDGPQSNKMHSTESHKMSPSDNNNI